MGDSNEKNNDRDKDNYLLKAGDVRRHTEERLRAKTTDMHSSLSEVETQRLVI